GSERVLRRPGEVARRLHQEHGRPVPDPPGVVGDPGGLRSRACVLPGSGARGAPRRTMAGGAGGGGGGVGQVAGSLGLTRGGSREGRPMTTRRIWTTFGAIGLALAAIALIVWAVPAAAQVTKVRLQLKWVTQAQFAGYYAAKSQGFYKAENLDVTIIPGGPDIVPEQVVAGRGAEFGIDWLPSLLSAREQGVPLVNIGQVFAYSGMRELAFKTSGIK